jgi:hypothetical protein
MSRILWIVLLIVTELSYNLPVFYQLPAGMGAPESRGPADFYYFWFEESAIDCGIDIASSVYSALSRPFLVTVTVLLVRWIGFAGDAHHILGSKAVKLYVDL